MRDDERWNTEILTKHYNLWGRDLSHAETCGTDWPWYQVKTSLIHFKSNYAAWKIHVFVICSCEWAVKKKGLKKKHLKGEYSIGKPQTLELHCHIKTESRSCEQRSVKTSLQIICLLGHVQRCKWGDSYVFRTIENVLHFFIFLFF